jgi:hypothetical protein
MTRRDHGGALRVTNGSVAQKKPRLKTPYSGNPPSAIYVDAFNRVDNRENEEKLARRKD